jgi:hypothetical protein
MKKFLCSLNVLSLCLWVGSMVFFSFLFAPLVFKVLPRDMASLLQNALFPRYFLFLVIVSAITWLTLILLRFKRWLSLMAAVSTAIFFYCQQKITPKLASLSQLGLGQSDDFHFLHRFSVILNSVGLLIGLFLLLFIYGTKNKSSI